MKTAKIMALLSIALLLATGCSEEESIYVPVNTFTAPVITGYIMKDINGQEMACIGHPNIKTLSETGHRLVCYPNPACEYLHIAFHEAAGIEKKIWIVAAREEAESSFQPYTFNAVTKVIEGIHLAEGITYQDQLTLSVEFFPEGFYKIYCMIGGELLHDNLLINQSACK